MATSTTRLTLSPPRAPRLPDAELTYLPGYINRLLNILRLYFNQLDSFTQTVVSGDGGKYLSAPYGAFQDSTTQTAAINTATALTFNTTDFTNEVYISDGSKLRVVNPGVYNLQFSVQIQNTDNATHDINIWLRQGNDGGTSTDIAGSTGIVGLPPRKSATDYYHSITGWNYFVQLQADDFIQIYWSVDTTAVSINAYPAATLPTRPSTASAVVSMSFVSALP